MLVWLVIGTCALTPTSVPSRCEQSTFSADGRAVDAMVTVEELPTSSSSEESSEEELEDVPVTSRRARPDPKPAEASSAPEPEPALIFVDKSNVELIGFDEKVGGPDRGMQQLWGQHVQPIVRSDFLSDVILGGRCARAGREGDEEAAEVDVPRGLQDRG